MVLVKKIITLILAIFLGALSAILELNIHTLDHQLYFVLCDVAFLTILFIISLKLEIMRFRNIIDIILALILVFICTILFILSKDYMFSILYGIIMSNF